MDRSAMDDGLTKSWALYWTSIQPESPYNFTDATPAPAPSPGSVPTPGAAPTPQIIYCNPDIPEQLCPGGLPCPPSGMCNSGDEAPTEAPSPAAPSPAAPAPPVQCAPNQGQMCPPGNIPCPDCGSVSCDCPTVSSFSEQRPAQVGSLLAQVPANSGGGYWAARCLAAK